MELGKLLGNLEEERREAEKQALTSGHALKQMETDLARTEQRLNTYRLEIGRARSERNGFELNRFGQALLPHGPHSVRECPSSRQESNGISIRLASGNSLSFFVVRLGREPFNPQAEENLRPSTAPVSHQKRFHITNR